MRRLVYYVIAFFGLAFFYYCLFAVWPRNDDNASGYLRGLEIVSGNWLMKGWKAGADSFLLCELPLFALLVKLGEGLRSLYQVPALCWSGVVCLSLYLAGAACETKKVRREFVFVFLGIPLLKGNPILYGISDPLLHIGGTAYMLGGYALLYAFVREKVHARTALPCYFVLVTAATAGDPMMTFVALLPVLVNSLVRLTEKRESPVSHLSILGVSILAWLCSKLIVYWVHHHGLHIERANMRFSNFLDLPRNLWLLAWALLGFSGADFSGKVLTLSQLPGLILNLAKLSYLGFARSAWPNLKRNPDYLDSLLAVAVVIGSAAFVLSSNVSDLATTRYWIPGYIFLTVLISRNLPVTPLAGRLLLGIGLGSLAVALLSNDWKRVAHPQITTPDQAHLITLLNRRKLQDGFGTYWFCHTITAATEGQIRIRPLDGGTPAAPYLWLTSYRDYEPGKFRGSRIFVAHPTSDERFAGPSAFGTPLDRFQSGEIQVEVFERDDQLLSSLYRQAESNWVHDGL